MLEARFVDLLACPRCRGPIEVTGSESWLACRADGLAFPVTDGIACLVEGAARPLAEVPELAQSV